MVSACLIPAAAVFLLVLSGFWHLQVGNSEFYSERAECNSIKALPVLAPRGKILDRHGRVIVDKHLCLGFESPACAGCSKP